MVWTTFSGIKSKDYEYKITNFKPKQQNPSRNFYRNRNIRLQGANIRDTPRYKNVISRFARNGETQFYTNVH